MQFNPLEHFTGRQDEIAQFDLLIADEQNRWVLLVDGLSGTGKTLLLDWLRRYRCVQIPNAKVTLSLNTNTSDLLASVADQLGPKIGKSYREGTRQLDLAEQQRPLVQYAPVSKLSGSLGGSIRDASQQHELTIELDGYEEVIRLQRETRRLDLLVDALAPLHQQKWILFIDEAGNLEHPDLERVVLERLIPRLHNFPGFRLYLTGQIVPRGSFTQHERLDTTLDAFPLDGVRQLLGHLGINDTKVQEAIFALTLGHPLLTGMLVEDLLERGARLEQNDLLHLEEELDERERTEWIYQRILSGIENRDLREVAANLSLFEWFDLSLLRAVFGAKLNLSEEDFNDLIRRSFVKALDSGRWRCHDIIIKYLRPQRAQLAPTETRDLHRQVFQALQTRLTAEAEVEGSWRFKDRISFTSAAFHSVLFFSLDEARSFLLSEIVLGFPDDLDYLYSLIRFVDRHPIPPPIREIVNRTKRVLDAWNLEKLDQDLVDFISELAAHAETRDDVEIASELFAGAALLSSAIGQASSAVALAERARKLDPSLENSALVAERVGAAGDLERAKMLLDEAETRFGDSPILRMSRARLALSSGNRTQTIQLLVDTVAHYPQDVDTRMMLAQLFTEDEQFEAALSQVEVVLEAQPSHSDALLLRGELLGDLGRVSEIATLVGSADYPIARSLEDLGQVLRQFSEPVFKQRMLNALAADPASVPTADAFMFASTLALQGDLENFNRVFDVVRASWPETAALGENSRALALLQAGRVDDARILAETLIEGRAANPDAYFVLATSYARAGQADKQRAVLEQIADRFPAFRDAADELVVRSYLGESSLEKALDYLDRATKQRDLGPLAQDALADVYAARGDASKAVEILEELVYTAERETFTFSRMILSRSKLAMLLAGMGERARAIQIAYGFLELTADRLLTASYAAAIFIAVQDEDGLRTAFQATDRWSAYDRGFFNSHLASMIVNRKPTVENLMTELGVHPDRIEIVFAIDVLLTRTNQLDAAPQVFSQIEHIAPGAVDSYVFLRQNLLAQIDSGSIAQLKAAKKAKPGDPEPRIALGNIYLARGKFDAAKSEFEDLVRIQPTLKDLVISMQVDSLVAAGQLDAAHTLVEPYLQLVPPPAALVVALATYLAAAADADTQIHFATMVAESYPDLRQSAYERIIDIQMDQNHYAEALDLIDRLEEQRAHHPRMQLVRVRALRELGRTVEVLQVLEALLSQPGVSDLLRGQAWYERAIVYDSANQLDQALQAYREAIKLMPDESELYFEIAEIYSKHMDWEQAYDALMSGLALQPARLREYEQTLHDLQQIKLTSQSSVVAKTPATQKKALAKKPAAKKKAPAKKSAAKKTAKKNVKKSASKTK